jgi:hypothetical protein
VTVPVYQTVLIYAGIPLLVVLLFAVLTLPGGRKRPRWKSGQPWEHEPIWYEPHPAAGTQTGGGDAHGPLAHTGQSSLGAGTQHAALPAGGEALEQRAAAAGPLGGARGTW